VQRVDEARERELSAFSRYCNIKNICAAIYFNAGIIISALVFLLVDKSTLDLGKVFSTLALLGYIFNFSILYSNYAIESLFAMSVFNRRVEEIVTQHLANARASSRAIVEVEDARAPCLAVQNVTASWTAYDENSAAEAPLFRNLNLDLAAGQNVAIIGPVGAGKTSLLMLVLGEMPVQQGEVRIKKGAQIVYAEQEPLIVTGTVESNILFGLKMDRQWYNEVVHACCLDEDFPALAAGD
jgi:ATP-binding cassette subfamily C (CFTR/MRP) protein 4